MTATLLARIPGAAVTLPPEVDLALAAARTGSSSCDRWRPGCSRGSSADSW